MLLPLDRIAGLNAADVRAMALEDWGPLDPEGVAEGTPEQHGVMILPGPTPDEGLGIWRCTAYVSNWFEYTVHEYVQLIDGEVTLETEHCSTTWRGGDSFFIPAGLRLRWVQPVTVLKIFYIAAPT